MVSERDIAFPILTGAQIATLEARGRRRAVKAGDVLFTEGDRGYSFFVVIAGAVDILESSRGRPRSVVVHQAQQFSGDVDMLTGRAALVTGRVAEDGEVLELSPSMLREAVDEDPDLGEVIIKAFLMRRSLLLSDGFEGVKIIGSRFSSHAHSLRDFATRNAIPFTWIDLEGDPQAEALLRQFGIPASDTPVVIGREGKFHRRPSIEGLARCAGLDITFDPAEVHDLIVVGAGPSGLAAAVYAASEGLDVIVLEREATGGQAGTSSRIENYLGFPAGISGAELTRNALLQAQRFGARITVPGVVARLGIDDGVRTVTLADGTRLRTRCVLVATGVSYRRLDLPGFRDFEGAGIYYAATEMEARLCRGDDVIVAGAGNSAGQAIVHLSRHARTVHVVVRGDDSRQEHVALPRRSRRAHRQRRDPPRRRHQRGRRRRTPDHRPGPQRIRRRDARGDARPVHVHRRRCEHRLAGRLRRPRREGLRPDGAAADTRDGRHPQMGGRRTAALSSRNEPAGGLRGRRCPQRLRQALCFGGRRGRDCRELRARAHRQGAVEPLT